MSIKGRELRKGRCFVVLAILFIMISFTCNSITALADTEYDHDNCQAVTVKSGDSLWKVVADNCGNYDGDIRELIHDVKNINNLSSATIYPGEVIYVPVYY